MFYIVNQQVNTLKLIAKLKVSTNKIIKTTQTKMINANCMDWDSIRGIMGVQNGV
jgi:hypothetical protein